MISVTEENQDLSKAAKPTDEIYASDADVIEVSKQMIAENMEAYKVLAE